MLFKSKGFGPLCLLIVNALARYQAIAQYLSKRAKRTTGFLSFGTSKKATIQSLQSTILRQQFRVSLPLL